MLFRVTRGEKGLVKSMEEIRLMARRMIEEEEVNVLILSDRGVNREFAPIPALLAVAGLHHYLIREGLRTRVSLVLETGEAREVHHFALLIGYGVSAINPYVAFETIDSMIRDERLTNIDHRTACKNMVKAATKGVIKVMAKMGISAIQSYRGAQVFEAVGLRQDVIDEYFTWTPSRIGGIGMDVIAQEVLVRHRAAFPERRVEAHTLPPGGQYQWRSEGEFHLFNPESIHRLQKAVRNDNFQQFQEYSRLVNEQATNLATLRGLLDLKGSESVPLEEVETVESIMKRFKTGAMSYGSISKEAHETLAIAMNRIGGKSNTGEGGEDPERFERLPNGDWKNSAIKQVASGRFGVTSEYLVSANENGCPRSVFQSAPRPAIAGGSWVCSQVGLCSGCSDGWRDSHRGQSIALWRAPPLGAHVLPWSRGLRLGALFRWATQTMLPESSVRTLWFKRYFSREPRSRDDAPCTDSCRCNPLRVPNARALTHAEAEDR
jgi:glutamate synthase (ferredoxin)